MNQSTQCPKCGFQNPNPTECLKCGIFFEKYRRLQEKKAGLQQDDSDQERLSQALQDRGIAPAPILSSRPYDDAPSSSSDSPFDDEAISPFKLNLWSIPGAILFFIVAKITVVPDFFLVSARVYFHEFGHAFIGWWSSHAATPFILWTNISPHASPIVFICFAFLLGVTAYTGIQQKCYFLTAVAAVFFLCQIFFTFIASTRTFHIAVAFGGIAGEFTLSTLVIIAFYYPLPKAIRWDFFRFLALPVAMHTFISSTSLWWRIRSNYTLTPWGSAIHGGRDAGGDLNRLHDLYQWNVSHMVKAYLTLASICGIVILAHYAFFTWRAYKEADA